MGHEIESLPSTRRQGNAFPCCLFSEFSFSGVLAVIVAAGSAVFGQIRPPNFSPGLHFANPHVGRKVCVKKI
jgi:hypothetical protein